jgi:hypothetical protein
MNKDKVKDIREKILSGLDLSFQRLLIAKEKEDGELIFSENGQIIRIKAKDLKEKNKKKLAPTRGHTA